MLIYEPWGPCHAERRLISTSAASIAVNVISRLGTSGSSVCLVHLSKGASQGAAAIRSIALLLLAALLFVGGALLWSDQPPLKTIESFAMRHADKLPLEYLGKKLFDKHCASCHDNPAMHAPSREALGGFSKESVMVALEFGKMQPMAAHLSKTERGLIDPVLYDSQ